LSLAVPPVTQQGSSAAPAAIEPLVTPEPAPATQSSPPILKAVPPETIPAQPPPVTEPTRPPPSAREPLPETVLTTPEESAAPVPPPALTEAMPPPVALPIPPSPPMRAVAPSQLATTTRNQAHQPPLRQNVPQPTHSAPQALSEITRTSPLGSPLSTPSSSTPPAGAPSAAASQIISPSWEEALSDWINAHKFYPELAQQRGQQGTVSLRFTVQRDGHVIGVALTQSSGSSILDAAAERLLRDARVPPLPADISQPQITVTIPIRYLLEP
jgi:periplasmic protein TonB